MPDQPSIYNIYKAAVALVDGVIACANVPAVEFDSFITATASARVLLQAGDAAYLDDMRCRAVRLRAAVVQISELGSPGERWPLATWFSKQKPVLDQRFRAYLAV